MVIFGNSFDDEYIFLAYTIYVLFPFYVLVPCTTGVVVESDIGTRARTWTPWFLPREPARGWRGKSATSAAIEELPKTEDTSKQWPPAHEVGDHDRGACFSNMPDHVDGSVGQGEVVVLV